MNTLFGGDVWRIISTVISVLSFCGVCIGGICGWWAWRKITTNHLYHQDLAIKEIKGTMETNKCKNEKEHKEIFDKIDEVGKDVAYIKGYLERKQ